MKKISVIVPAYNEEKNILKALENIIEAFERLKIEGEIVVVDDGSGDKTKELVQEKAKENPNLIKLVSNEKNKGIGYSFFKGVEIAEGEAVVMIPGDNENDAFEVLRYHHLLEDVDIIVNFIFNKEIRPLSRRIFSFLYNFLINLTFLCHFHYTNGTNIIRRSLLTTISHKSRGFGFQAEILVKLVKRGYLFAEVPSRLKRREKGESKALKWSTFWQTLKEFINLFLDIYFREKPSFKEIIKDSITYQRKFLKENEGK
ncbi:MAG: glycosyltransferase family 2 protein [Candidatus Paceibacterota bacterium]